MTNPEQSPPADVRSPFDDVGPTLSRLRRRAGAGRGDLTRNIVLNIVEDAAGRITVGGVAAEMGVAQPVASRAVATCIAEGLVRRVAVQQDGRSTMLELTDAGQRARRTYAAEQRHVFEQITAHWDETDRVQFARLLSRYGQDARAWSTRVRTDDAGAGG